MIRVRRLLVVVLLVVIALLAVRAVADIWLKGRSKTEIARLEEKYGPLQYDAVRNLRAWKSWPQRIAPENRARLIDAAAARITLVDANANFMYHPHTGTSVTADQARSIADGNREAVQLAVAAANLRHSNWDIAYLGEADNVPNLMDLGYLAKVLTFAARSDTDAGHADDAIADVRAGFAQSAAMSSEPLTVMLVNAIMVAYEQSDALKDVLNRSEPSGPALAALASTIEESLIASPAREALLGELKHSRFTWPLVMEGWLWGRRSLDYSTPTSPTAWMRAVAWTFRPVIRYMALRDYSEKAQALDLASLPAVQRAGQLANLRTRAASAIRSADLATGTIARAAIAVALRRFRIDHGGYPVTLDELVPAYLKTVPIDAWTGKRPDYRRSGGGFELPAEMPSRDSGNWNGGNGSRIWKVER
ncbi:MAG: hypothetical protein KAY59_02320 [Acidobacteria bacterium]|nr:hypothetical protein [Acidobacteriota bacterium]